MISFIASAFTNNEITSHSKISIAQPQKAQIVIIDMT